MEEAKRKAYEKRGQLLVKHLKSRCFDACYCATREEALAKALEQIPEGASIGWGGSASAREIGLMDAIRQGNYRPIDRDNAAGPEEAKRLMKESLLADVFLTGTNALSLDGELVNIDGTGNRLGGILFGPEKVLVIAGMNKVVATLEDAGTRARTVAAPMNKQRFPMPTPCEVTGTCGDCKGDSCICNQILITRNCRPAGRISVILVGEDLGF